MAQTKILHNDSPIMVSQGPEEVGGLAILNEKSILGRLMQYMSMAYSDAVTVTVIFLSLSTRRPFVVHAPKRGTQQHNPRIPYKGRPYVLRVIY